MTVDDLLAPYEEHLLRDLSRSPRTVVAYRRAIVALDQALPFGADIAHEEELKSWIWRDGLEAATRAVYWAAIRSFYSWATQARMLDYDPSQNITRPKVPQGLPRVADNDHVRIVLTRARQPYLLWAQLAAYAGLRCIEIHRLHREHVNERTLSVHRGKGQKARVIPTHPLIWREVRGLPPGPLTSIVSERRLSTDFLLHCQNVLGLRGVSMHRLRGWFATNHYRKHKDLLGLQKILGHSNPATTAVYVGIADEDLQAIIDALPTFEHDE